MLQHHTYKKKEIGVDAANTFIIIITFIILQEGANIIMVKIEAHLNTKQYSHGNGTLHLFQPYRCKQEEVGVDGTSICNIIISQERCRNDKVQALFEHQEIFLYGKGAFMFASTLMSSYRVRLHSVVAANAFVLA